MWKQSECPGLRLHPQGEEVYTALTHASGFYRDIFKVFKGMFSKIFMHLVDELDEVEGFAGCGELSLMQHEQIVQNEPASQTEQAAMPAWTQRVVAAGETGALPPTPAPPPPMPPADAAAPPHRLTLDRSLPALTKQKMALSSN